MLARANGGTVDIPDLDQAIARFNTALAAVPEQVADRDRHTLLTALGLR
ncbi:hypothetical protein [Catenuloplanes atrovinosus]|uniref:Uncharacterized protein n=1 Tax=Catenuloplanes atrovinosus TaxID=137266 RepID=A0AAE4CC81_9ACTN|nr:hypothetical protein [Catenuloplanes atrovinosus]MDR7278937.1 hypothetical protein [Catenuloplanes atrovinosus]